MPGVTSTTRNWLELVHEAEPEFEQKKDKVRVYDFSNGRVFYDRRNPYSGTSTST